jgi:biopolymer transport protein ExbB
MGGSALGIAHYWAQADGVIRATAWLLLAMSVASWFLILWKSLAWLRVRRASRSLDQFWTARSMDEAVAAFRPLDREAIFVPLAASAQQAATRRLDESSMAARIDRSELITRALRQRINEAAARLESGQTLLASVGATAPFVGLFGTVWGIYHALTAIGIAGQASIDKVAGPVGEALIMTAIGLAVAVPAVMGYNWLVRRNKVLMETVRAFGADIHAVLLGKSGQAAPASAARAR